MATHRDQRIKSQPPPTDNGAGLFSRLLQRTKSKKERNQGVYEEHSKLTTTYDVPAHASAAAAPIVVPQPTWQAKPAQSTQNMGAPTVHHQQPPQMLKKRASIRDRFRSLAKDAPDPTPTSRPEKQRVPYVPTHAAADFSRMAVAPRPMSRQQQRQSSDGPRTFPQRTTEPLIPAPAYPAEEEPQSPEGPRHLSQRVLETLDENEPVQMTSAQRQTGQHVPDIDAPLSVAAVKNSRQQHEGRATLNDTVDPLPNLPTSPPARVHESSEQGRIVEARSEKELSDYELFLARAEERERAHREHLLRTLSQRQYPRPEPEANQYHPRNSATYTADSAVVAEASGPLRKGWEGRMSGLDSGIGSKTSSQQGEGSKLQSEEPPTRVSNTWERGHRKRASWTPSFGAGGGREAERRLERGSDAVPELDEGHRVEDAHLDTYTTSRNSASASAERVYAAQQPRTLKRQTSITQKLGSYIKPARPVTRYEEPELTRGRSKRTA